MVILETDRLRLRELEEGDLEAMGRILKDPEVMYAYEHGFSDQEVRQWLDRNLQRYAQDGFGLWAVIEKESGELTGLCGLTWQDWAGRQVPEIGYQFRKDRWHHGFAAEAAVACREFAFHKLDFPEVYSIIRDSNLPSQRVAARNGMAVRGSFVKRYYGVDMPHLVFSVRRDAVPICLSLGERTEETVAAYFQKSRHPAIQAVLPQRARTLEEALADYRRTLEPGAGSYGRTIWADGAYVGDVWCYAMDPSGDPQAMVSYCVFQQSLWGRGIASRALGLFLSEIRERFGLERVGAFTYTANRGSIRVLEKNGFRLAESFVEDGVESRYYLRP